MAGIDLNDPAFVQRAACCRLRSACPRCTYFGGASVNPRPGELPAAALRRVLEALGAHQAPTCYDALSARLVERVEFRACFTSGTCSIFCLYGGVAIS